MASAGELGKRIAAPAFRAGPPAWVLARFAAPLARGRPLSFRGRAVLCLAVAVALGVDIGIEASEPMTWARLLDISAILGIGLIAWRPAVAALALCAGGLAAVGLGDVAAYALALAFASGLVVATAPRAACLVFLATVPCLALTAVIVGAALTPVGAIATTAVAVASAAIGLAFRSAGNRERSLHARLGALTEASDAAVRAERDRITDELHNIIAHDLTIVAMHARALRYEFPGERSLSLEAVEESAVQALKDIRRMLRIVQDGADELVDEEGDEPLDVVLRRACASLTELGVPLTLTLPPGEIAIASSIETTLTHVAREAITNVMRHSRTARSVQVVLEQSEKDVVLTVVNDLPRQPGPPGPPGYGLERMGDRVRILGGVFAAGPVDGTWRLSARLPRS